MLSSKTMLTLSTSLSSNPLVPHLSGVKTHCFWLERMVIDNKLCVDPCLLAEAECHVTLHALLGLTHLAYL